MNGYVPKDTLIAPSNRVYELGDCFRIIEIRDRYNIKGEQIEIQYVLAKEST